MYSRKIKLGKMEIEISKDYEKTLILSKDQRNKANFAKRLHKKVRRLRKIGNFRMNI